jgi:hypothetical protein
MRDPILESAINLAGASEPEEAGVLLLVGGILVSGYIVSAKSYQEGQRLMKTRLGSTKEQEQLIAASAQIAPDFIHLRDTQYSVPGQSSSASWVEGYSRISLDAVNGFSFLPDECEAPESGGLVQF